MNEVRGRVPDVLASASASNFLNQPLTVMYSHYCKDVPAAYRHLDEFNLKKMVETQENPVLPIWLLPKEKVIEKEKRHNYFNRL